MTNRERLLSIMSGQSPDRIPWIPRLLLWYNAHKRAGTLPSRYQSWDLRQIEADLRMGTPARDGRVFASQLQKVEVKSHQLDDMRRLTEYITPVGAVNIIYRGSQFLREKGISDLQVEFMLKRREDYAVVEYIIENTRYFPTYDQYEKYEQEVGEDGYPLVSCGDCPFHHWMRSLAGYETAYYHLNDYPNQVERLLSLMEQIEREVIWKLIAESPARLILHGVHFSSQMTPPSVFDQFIIPYYRDLSSLLQKRGKTLSLHADNDTSQILSHIKEAGYGMVECFVTDPMVPTTLKEAREAWGDQVIIWGGIPSVILEEVYSETDFEAYMKSLFKTIAPGEAFILGVADNVMPDAKLERLKRVSEMVEKWGRYPVSPENIK